MPKSLYLHVPFCPKICPYCDFHKMRRNEDLVASYLKKIDEDAEKLFDEFPTRLETIYWGGGTPSHLSDKEISTIISSFEKSWGWPAQLETSLEADPLTFTKERLQTFKAMGFSRLSLGLQSSQDAVLQFLGRRHSGYEALEALELALDAGFEVSADVITGLSMQDTSKDLDSIARSGLPHLSVYSLSIEPYTPFALRNIKPDEDKEASDYLLTHSLLKSYGLERYEVSSHAKPGHESKHNQVYWHGEYFLQLGPSAAGFLPKPGFLGERRTNPPLKAWLKDAEPERLALSPRDYLIDSLMTGLRTKTGIDLARLKTKTGIDITEKCSELIGELQKHQLLIMQPGRLSLSDTGLLQLNGILRRFVQAV